MTTALLLISDGREEALGACLRSLDLHLPLVDHVVHVDDAAHRLGFAGAIEEGWRRLRRLRRLDYVIHIEQDFVFRDEVPLAAMCALLERQPHLAQVVLKRQAWNDDEKRAGGIIEQHPGDYAEREDGFAVWTEHRRFWSTNPGVYRAATIHAPGGWPQVPQSEGTFTHQLLRDPLLRFAFWGAKYDPPRVAHIGERVGAGY